MNSLWWSVFCSVVEEPSINLVHTGFIVVRLIHTSKRRRHEEEGSKSNDNERLCEVHLGRSRRNDGS